MKKFLIFTVAICLILTTVGTAYGANYYNLPDYHADVDLPSAYRSAYVSYLDQQGGTSLCWAYATAATVESSLKKAGLYNSADNKGYYNLDETALSSAIVPKCSICGEKCILDSMTLNLVCTSCGGSGFGYLRIHEDSNRSSGMDSWAVGYMTSHSPMAEDGSKVDFLITDAMRISSADTSSIKRVVIDYGSATMFFDSDTTKRAEVEDERGKRYITFGSRLPLIETASHSVSVIGWDDDFDRTYFDVNVSHIRSDLERIASRNPYFTSYYLDQWGVSDVEEFLALTDDEIKEKFLPKSNGAWLVKNSWVAESHATYNGYGWISYEDCSINQVDAYAVSGVVRYDYQDKLYAHDEYGAAKALSPIPNGSVYSAVNVYDIGANESITHVTFYTHDGEGADYSIYVRPYSSLSADIASLQPIASGKISHNGYFTAKIDPRSLVPLSAGEYAIIVKVDGHGQNISFGVDARVYAVDEYMMLSILQYVPKVGDEESFVIANDSLYTASEAMGEECNLSIKVMTTTDKIDLPVHYSPKREDAVTVATAKYYPITVMGEDGESKVPHPKDDDDVPDNNFGLIIGVSSGCAVLVSALLVLYLIKRQRPR